MTPGPERPLPTGKVPCGRCGLLIGASEAGTWSATGNELTHARHRYDYVGINDGCLRAMGALLNELTA